MCRGLGIPVVDWREVRRSRWDDDRSGVRREMAAFAAGAADPRLMIKPARLGSSVGMTLAHDAAELATALDLAFRYDSLALVELYVADARDLEVSVIGNDHARLELYGPGEVVSGHEFYDYEAKYTPGLSETSTHAEVSDVEKAVIHKLTRDVYRAIGAEGFARIDFLMAGERIVVSEINTIPGFTPISLFPTMPAVAGYSFTDVCLRVVELALERHARRPATHLTPTDLPR
jgi:D-alanine-D-alanine ligase